MNTITFTLRKEPKEYLKTENMTPDYCAGKTASEIAKMPVYTENQTLTLGTFFDVKGTGGTTAEDTKLVLNGDLKKINNIGMRMTAGEIVVNGSTDMYTGAWMKGGSITVNGNVDSFAAIGMEGGSIVINGNARDFLGAAYRGDWRGLQGGCITVKGDIGTGSGMFMRNNAINSEKTEARRKYREKIKLSDIQKAELSAIFKDAVTISATEMRDIVKEKYGIEMKTMQVSRLMYELQRE